jgi:hypothetical protein
VIGSWVPSAVSKTAVTVPSGSVPNGKSRPSTPSTHIASSGIEGSTASPALPYAVPGAVRPSHVMEERGLPSHQPTDRRPRQRSRSGAEGGDQLAHLVGETGAVEAEVGEDLIGLPVLDELDRRAEHAHLRGTTGGAP